MSTNHGIRQPVYGKAAERAYAAWKDHLNTCERCGAALAPCTAEPELWGAYRAATEADR